MFIVKGRPSANPAAHTAYIEDCFFFLLLKNTFQFTTEFVVFFSFYFLLVFYLFTYLVITSGRYLGKQTLGRFGVWWMDGQNEKQMGGRTIVFGYILAVVGIFSFNTFCQTTTIHSKTWIVSYSLVVFGCWFSINKKMCFRFEIVTHC